MDKLELYRKVVETRKRMLKDISEAIGSLDEEGVYSERILSAQFSGYSVYINERLQSEFIKELNRLFRFFRVGHNTYQSKDLKDDVNSERLALYVGSNYEFLKSKIDQLAFCLSGFFEDLNIYLVNQECIENIAPFFPIVSPENNRAVIYLSNDLSDNYKGKYSPVSFPVKEFLKREKNRRFKDSPSFEKDYLFKYFDSDEINEPNLGNSKYTSLWGKELFYFED